MVPELLEIIPEHSRYVEVFGGSAELLFSKQRSRHEVYNDINGYLVNLFVQVRDNLERLMERLNWLPFSRDIYENWSHDYQHGVAPSDPIENAARFYYVLCSQFAGKMYSGWAIGKTSWTQRRVENLKTINDRLQGVAVDCNSFEKVLQTWDSPETFFFLDPPYLGMTGYRMGFGLKQHKQLRLSLEDVQGKWVLTINDHPTVRKMYREYPMIETETKLSSEKLTEPRKRADLKQLIISNYS